MSWCDATIGMASRSVFLAVYNLYGVDRSGDVASAWLDKSWERRVEFLKSNIHLRKTRSLFDDRTPTAAHQSIPAPPPQHTHTHTHSYFQILQLSSRRAGTIFQLGGGGSRSKIRFIMQHDTLIFTQYVAELTTGHIIVVTLYVNIGTWSLKYLS